MSVVKFTTSAKGRTNYNAARETRKGVLSSSFLIYYCSSSRSIVMKQQQLSPKCFPVPPVPVGNPNCHLSGSQSAASLASRSLQESPGVSLQEAPWRVSRILQDSPGAMLPGISG